MFSVCPNLNLQQFREVCALSLLVFVYGLSAACVWAQAESGQDLVRSHAVEIISDEVTIDGILDEAVWKSTSTIGDLIQREPKQGRRLPNAPRSISFETPTIFILASKLTIQSQTKW